jgi:repressor of nif and glnA expression
VTVPTLTRVELAILEILENYRDDEIQGRELRGLLSNRGFRRSAPAFVFTMMSLEDKGLVTCREDVYCVDGLEIKERYYSPMDI